MGIENLVECIADAALLTKPVHTNMPPCPDEPTVIATDCEKMGFHTVFEKVFHILLIGSEKNKLPPWDFFFLEEENHVQCLLEAAP